jgi:hypothetical protein
VSKLEEEAAAFKRKKEQQNERQARHRSGIRAYPVPLHKSIVQQLIAKGAISADASVTDIGMAVAKIAVDAISRMPRPLPPETIVDELVLRPPAGPKAKGKHRRKKHPGRILTGAEKARAAAQIMAEEGRQRIEDEERAYIEKKWPAYDPVKDLAWRKARLARERKEKEEALRAKIAATLPQAPKARVFQSLGGSGIRKKGGKPVTNGFGAAPRGKSQADTVKPIKMKPKAADVKKFADITPTDEGVHTLPATDAEMHKMYWSRGSYEKD